MRSHELGWPRRVDLRRHGWRGNTFGPLPEMEAPPAQRAAETLLSQTQCAEARRKLIKAVGVK